MIGHEKVTGTVKRITYHNEENGFCILKLNDDKGNSVPVKGFIASISVGESVVCHGQWINDKKFGMQFSAEKISASSPTTVKGIESYLSSGVIKGIGKVFAKKLVDTFGDKTFDVIEKTPEKLLEIHGVGPSRVESIINAWEDGRYIRDIMVFLQEHGVGNANVVRIYKKYGKNTIDKVKENPYSLARDVKGIGFKSADKIALSLGLPKDSILRARSGILHVLFELSGRGDVCSTRENLIKESVDILEIESFIVEDAINIELKIEDFNKQIIKSETIDGIEYIYAKKFYFAEINIAANLYRISKNFRSWKNIDFVHALPWVQEKLSVSLSDSQEASVKRSLNNVLSIITGGPGVGKTTVLNSILQIAHAKKIDFILCAPTGKAAKRMNVATGFESKTIHRLLGRGQDGNGFKYNKENPLRTNLLIIDEFSMVDVKLMDALLAAVSNNTAVIFVGDVDQLPSVGAGTVLKDMIDSGCIPTSKLDKIFRQAEGSHIITNAHLVNAGKMPKKQEDGVKTDFYMLSANEPEGLARILKKVVTVRAKKGLGFDPVKDVQVLSPANNGLLGVRSLNAELQEALNPFDKSKNEVKRFGTTYRVGDKVIQTSNNYDKEVFNGDSGFIHSIDNENEILIVEFDGNKFVEYEFYEIDDLSLSYAMTIHKSQGSEYPCVVIPVSTQHFMLLERNLIYTGITRGKQMVIIVCQYKAMGMAVKKVSSNKRTGNLVYRIKSLFNKPKV